ncbi:MAG: hypothetical protein V2A76_12095 [Planctomycetota bacterium]
MLKGCVLLGFLAGLLPACGSTGDVPQLRSGSVGVGSSSELERLIDSVHGGLVALVLDPVAPGRPHRVVLAAQVETSPAAVRRALIEVETYPDTVDQVVGVVVRERSSKRIVFDMELELPFQNLHYGLEYDIRDPLRVDVVGISGALEGGRWCWELKARNDGTVVVYTSECDLSDGSGLLLEQLLAMHPDLQEGMAFAQGMRLLRTICEQARRLDRRDP